MIYEVIENGTKEGGDDELYYATQTIYEGVLEYSTLKTPNWG